MIKLIIYIGNNADDPFPTIQLRGLNSRENYYHVEIFDIYTILLLVELYQITQIAIEYSFFVDMYLDVS